MLDKSVCIIFCYAYKYVLYKTVNCQSEVKFYSGVKVTIIRTIHGESNFSILWNLRLPGMWSR